jgi:hypothetical protein
MRARPIVIALALFLAVVTATVTGRAQSTSGSQYAGTYAGTWDGPATGTFELTLAGGRDGAIGGKVVVTGEGSDYNAELKEVVFDGNKMTAKYDFPPDPSGEIILAATFDAGTAKGTWSLRSKQQHDELVAGTWTVTKK